MGLAEKKVMKEIQENVLPSAKATLESIVGKTVEVTVDWDTFQSVDALKDLEGTAFGRIEDGIKLVCGDDLGKEAIAETVSEVKVSYVPGAEKRIDMKDGIFHVAGGWGDSLSDVFTDRDYKNFLEENL